MRDQQMTNFEKKARAGRNIALAGLSKAQCNDDYVSESRVIFKTNYRAGPIPFVSKRAQAATPVWIH
jgi:hypothetical protein